jgi:phosphatidylglycerophosphatase A
MNIRKLIVTFFGAGLSPVAPGTVGSIAATLVLLGLLQLQPSYWTWQSILSGGLLLSSIGTVALGEWAAVYFGLKDAQPIVLDEVAGICLTNLLLPWDRPVLAILIALVAFRIFDVTKPPPARQLEKLPAGWGVLLDDLAAASFANGLCRLVLLWVHF